MTTEQEALRLAEEGERRSKILRQEPPDWSAMLRKLVAEREADRAAMREALEALEAANSELHSIGDIAHDASTGPAVWDTYWNIRNAAYNAMDDAAITHLCQRLEGTS